MVQPDIKCAACGFPIVSVWLPDRSAGLCGTCADKAPALYLKEHARVAELEKFIDTPAIGDLQALKFVSERDDARKRVTELERENERRLVHIRNVEADVRRVGVPIITFKPKDIEPPTPSPGDGGCLCWVTKCSLGHGQKCRGNVNGCLCGKLEPACTNCGGSGFITSEEVGGGTMRCDHCNPKPDHPLTPMAELIDEYTPAPLKKKKKQKL